ncbi:MAG: keto-deoxy-phosphogluconate aldolase, partial [Colwellia sp.]|nr:keto-deoxy-phosphogluconate aldolase [Colwellia sp.]
ALPNVVCCGGSWLVSSDIVENKNWSAITKLAKQALAHVK